MSEKPILFNTEMVKAILDGRKTQTRRLIRPQPEGRLSYIFGGSHPGKWTYMSRSEAKAWDVDESVIHEEEGKFWTPPCNADDLLWVRETWAVSRRILLNLDPDTGVRHWSAWSEDNPGRYIYRAGYTYMDDPGPVRWHPSIHMPKDAARIWLKVKAVKVQRLQEITNDDAKAEGVTCATDNSGMMHRHKFRVLWDSITDAQTSWEANPYVWAYTFERIDNPRKAKA